jgi:clan AA aspartic protease (TIGR02281 family)
MGPRAAHAILCAFALQAAHAESVSLKWDSGTYVVPVVINDKITLEFTLDSGASDVSIPLDVFSTLVRTHTISGNDLLGKVQYTLADGSTHAAERFRIRSLRVGNLELRGVIASVAPPQGSLLLGQSFLSQLQSWSVDNKRHVLILNEQVVADGPTTESELQRQQTYVPPQTASPSSVQGSRIIVGPDEDCRTAQRLCADSESASCKYYAEDLRAAGAFCAGVTNVSEAQRGASQRFVAPLSPPDRSRITVSPEEDCRTAQRLCADSESASCKYYAEDLRAAGVACPGVTDTTRRP